jgi:hypothetical protein
MEVDLTRSTSVRIKLGIKVWSTLSAMLLSVVMISGCNEEPSGGGAAPGGAAGPGAGKAPDKGPAPAPSPAAKDGEKKGMP